jgi:glucosamine-6-phosphate deaminase
MTVGSDSSSVNESRDIEYSCEHVALKIYLGRDAASVEIARRIADLILDRQKQSKPAVLGLATGSSPVKVYGELIRLHREEGLSFKNVVTFNLDEYYPIERSHRESYYRFMHEQLFDHIDIPEENINIPNGEVSRADAYQHCMAYEQQIREAGGIDIQLLGIGRTGHIGFNEPGSAADSRTRLITLDSVTRSDAARDFVGEANVPRYAITMGVGTILEAREIILMAWGEKKASVVAEAVEGKPTPEISASFLQNHPNATFYLDESAASSLTRRISPWKVRFIDWDFELEHRAVIGLALAENKPILKLVEKDYSENSLVDLLTSRGSAYDINIKAFNKIQRTITGWPGGKPNADDTYRPERSMPERKRVVVFASEPGNEIQGMGGTINRLIQQGHDVFVCTLTTGSISVPDEEVKSFLGVLSRMGASDESGLRDVLGKSADLLEEMERKSVQDEDSPELRSVKGFLREAESQLALSSLGLAVEKAVFLRLPYYETGRYRQFHPGEEDVIKVRDFLEEIKPHQVFLGGTKADPASVEGSSFYTVEQALRGCADASWFDECRVWAYRDEGEEWDLSMINMAVPMSPDQLRQKLKAIYQHKTQHGGGPVKKSGELESWEAIGMLNRKTASFFDSLGLAEYEALECFRRFLD